jgi:hypothetical protein
MLFINYSSGLNTIVPSKLITKFRALGLENLCLQLDPGFPEGPTPGGEGRQHHLRHADPQHRGPTVVCAQSPPVLPLHPQLHGHAQLQHHQVC